MTSLPMLIAPRETGNAPLPVLCVAYDPATGEIRQHMKMAPAGFAQFEAATGLKAAACTEEAHARPDLFYVDPATGALAQKAEFPGVLDGLTIRELPIPCRVRIEWNSFDVDDGTAELTFAHPGTYRVEVIAPRHLTKVFEVTAA